MPIAIGTKKGLIAADIKKTTNEPLRLAISMIRGIRAHLSRRVSSRDIREEEGASLAELLAKAKTLLHGKNRLPPRPVK